MRQRSFSTLIASCLLASSPLVSAGPAEMLGERMRAAGAEPFSPVTGTRMLDEFTVAEPTSGVRGRLRFANGDEVVAAPLSDDIATREFSGLRFVGAGLSAEAYSADPALLPVAVMAPPADLAQAHREIAVRAKLAGTAGARALLLIRPDSDEPWSVPDLRLDLPHPPILLTAGLLSLERLFGNARLSSLLASAPITYAKPVTAIIEPQTLPRPTSNVMGIVAGGDPALAAQVVLIATVYGAAETTDARAARGTTSVLLSLVRDAAMASPRAARSLVFAALSAEQLGHAGSMRAATQMKTSGREVAAVVVFAESDSLPPNYVGVLGDPAVSARLAELLTRHGATAASALPEGAWSLAQVDARVGLSQLAAPSVLLVASSGDLLKHAAHVIDDLALRQRPIAAAATPSPEKSTRVVDDPLRDSREVHLKNLRQLTFGGENAEAYWSPDGRELVLQSTRPPYECDQIFMLNVATGSIRLISNGQGRTTCSYFMPSGLRVIYSSTHHVGPACPPRPDYSKGYVWSLYPYDIFSTRLDGTGVLQLTNGNSYDAEATVSHDGSRIVFTSDRDGDLELYTMAADGGDVRRITHEVGYDGGAFFSPDDKKLVYRAHHPTNEAAIRRYRQLLAEHLIEPKTLEIMVLDLASGERQQLTANGSANFAPYWFRDGKQIIFSSNLADQNSRNFDLYVVNEGGGTPERITFDETFDGFPMFSPDGSKLVFASNRNGVVRGETNVFVADWVD